MKNLILILTLSQLIISCGQIHKTIVDNPVKKAILNVETKAAEPKKEYTILVGKLLGQEHVPDIKPKGCFENNVYCTSSYYLYSINVQQVFSGEPLNGIIKVAEYQHAEYIYKGSDNSLFVIERITDENTAKLLGTDYFITEYVTPKITYCFSKKLDEYVPEIKETIYSNCLYQKDVSGGLKRDLIELVNNRVEKQLRNFSILLKHDYGYSDGVNILTEIDNDDDTCPSYTDLDKYDTDPRCNYGEDNDYNILVYEVSKGKASQVKQMILDELQKVKVNLDNIEMNFQIIEELDKSTLNWHYRINYLK